MVNAAHTEMTYGRVLYENLLRRSDATVTLTGTSFASFPAQNAYDWTDYAVWQIDAGDTAALDAEFAAPVIFDTWAIYTEPTGSDGATITIQKETSAGSGSYTNIAYIDIADSTAIAMADVGTQNIDSGRKVRILVEAGASVVRVRQVAYGSRLQFPMGQHEGVAPPSLTYGVVVDNKIAVNGSIIGRSYRRTSRKAEIDLEYLEPEWVRNTWEPFVKHSVRFPFFYQWAPESWAAEVVFAAAEEINPPRNSGPAALMSVTMPIHCLSDDLVGNDLLSDSSNPAIILGGSAGGLPSGTALMEHRLDMSYLINTQEYAGGISMFVEEIP